MAPPHLAALCLVSVLGAACLSAQTQGTTSAEVPRFHHLHLSAVDPARAVAFYTSAFPITSATEVAGFTALKSGHLHVLFTKVTAPPPSVPQSAYWHFGWNVPDTKTDYDRLNAAGIPFLPLYTGDEPPTVRYSAEWFAGGLFTRSGVAAAKAKGLRPQGTAGRNGFAYLAGSDGAKVELAGGTPARMNHVHMYQEHPYCAERWYARHVHAPLSGTAKRSTDRPPESAPCEVAMGEPTWPALEPAGTRRTPAGGVLFDDVEVNWYMRQGDRPLVSSRGQVMDHVGLQVSNLDAWLTRLSAEGVRILEKPYAFGSGRAALIEGPSLEAIELLEVK